ncbi:Nop14-like protein [Xylariomycetidae sp. FL0641]|nr:Nop14-like protein [Xylariomycetidae sp. FL0641]
MPGSQLKRLKAELRDKGVIGPQQSKKQKRRNAQDGKASSGKRMQKVAALDGIREQFNPFDLKHNVRGPKFQVTSNRPPAGNAAKGIDGRPGEAKALGEERRRQTLLVEMNRRNKVGGILDRRFGENDPTMAPEEKMLQRFVKEQQGHKKNSLFDLEDEPSDSLTHMGKSLSLSGPELRDDFEEDDLAAPSEDDDDSDDNTRALKRMRDSEWEEQDQEGTEGQPERKKTKQEVMKEVIAKSKFHKAERQAAKDADDDLREELDSGLQDLQTLLFNRRKDGNKTQTNESVPETGLTGKEKMERDYDLRLRQLAQDRRGQASERTKTDEEIAQEEVKKLKELEEKRLQRMRGEKTSDDEDDKPEEAEQPRQEASDAAFMFPDQEPDGEDFGLGAGIRARPTAAELGFDDEDDFLIDDNLVASSGSELELESDDDDDDKPSDAENEAYGDDDDEFTKGLLNEHESKDPAFSGRADGNADGDGLSYTCPQSLEEMIQITQGHAFEDVPKVVQKIRILYHPKLASENKAKLANFAKVLVQYSRHLSSLPKPPFVAIESIIRHTHSMAKSFPIEVSQEFRSHIADFGRTRPLEPQLADFTTLAAIAMVYPCSDHFHQVVTPSILVMARYLGHKIPKQVTDYCQGVFVSTLALQYLRTSQRYMPELLNFCLNALAALAPYKADDLSGAFPVHLPLPGMRAFGATKVEVKKLDISDCFMEQASAEQTTAVKIAAIATILQILDIAADIWSGKSSFIETFRPAHQVLVHLAGKLCRAQLPAALNDSVRKLQAKLETMLRVSQLSRRPLELHHHRPLAIKTSVPKFEDSFDPHKHYDNDRERAELAKLKAEHKKERKGALRELRKDANFMAREKLRVKKQKDAAYEKKYKRLVAEIQGEEGKEANAYEREKQMRKRASKR